MSFFVCWHLWFAWNFKSTFCMAQKRFSTLPWLGMTNMMSLKLSWYIGMGLTRSNDYLTMVDSKNAWNILLLFLGVSKNWGFLTLSVGFLRKKKISTKFTCAFSGVPHFFDISKYGPKVPPLFSWGGAHVASTSSCDTYLKRTWTLQSLGWCQGGMATRRFWGFFSAKFWKCPQFL